MKCLMFSVVIVTLLFLIMVGTLLHVIGDQSKQINQLQNTIPGLIEQQRFLIKRGYLEIGDDDGKCGDKTESALFSFKADESAGKYFTKTGAPR